MAEPRSSWTIKKDISLGDIIAFTVATAAVITAYFALDRRVSVLETATSDAAKVTEIWRQELRDDIKELNRKLDKAAEGKWK